MAKTLIIIISLLLIGFSFSCKGKKDVIIDKNILKNTDKPTKVIEEKLEGDFIQKGPAYKDDLGKSIKHGKWQILYPDGKLYSEGRYINGKKDGKWLVYYPSGKASDEANFKNDLQTGDYISYHPNGTIKTKGKFENSKPFGAWEWWYANGKIETKGMYYFGRKQEKWTYYSPDGKITAEGSFKDEFPIGKWTGIDTLGGGFIIDFPEDGKNGNVVGKTLKDKPFLNLTLNDGYLIGKAELFYTNGKICRRCTYISLDEAGVKKLKLSPKLIPFHIPPLKKNYQGVANGTNERYYTNGQLERLTTFSKGRINGIHKQFFENGKKRVECMYVNDVIAANSFKRWDEAGNLIETK